MEMGKKKLLRLNEWFLNNIPTVPQIVPHSFTIDTSMHFCPTHNPQKSVNDFFSKPQTVTGWLPN